MSDAEGQGPSPPTRGSRIKRWLITIAVIIGLLWLIGGINRYVPGQEDQPSLAKASLCDVASNIHTAYIDAAREYGLVQEAGVNTDGLYVIVVDEAMWAAEPIESQEVLAIAGWCQVTTPERIGIASVVGAMSRNELASVVEGEFRVPDGAAD